MKKRQNYRLFVQLLSVILFTIGFFTQFKATLIIIMVGTIFAGAYYCGWICPYGTLQEFASKLGAKLGIKKRKMPKFIQKYLQFVRYILFALFTLFTLDILFSLLIFDPRANLLLLISGNVISIISVIILTSFLAISLFFQRPFCNYLCIEGAKFGLMSLLRPVTIIRNADSCVNCKECDNVCPMNIEVSTSENLHSPNCINCFKCNDTCPIKKALTYGPISITKKVKTYYLRMVLLAVVVGSSFLFYSIAASNSKGSEVIIPEVVAEDTLVDNVESESLDKQIHGDGNGKIKIRNEANSENSTVVTENDDIIENNNSSTTAEVTTAEIDSPSSNTFELGSASGIANGTYTGIGRGFRGNMTVEVTVVDEQITNVEVVEHVEDYRWFVRAYDPLVSRIISAQSVDVDTVSGATYSSYGIIEGANAALESARN